MARPRICIRCRPRDRGCISYFAFQSWPSLRCPSGVSARIRRALVTGRRLPYRSGDQSVPDSLLPRKLAQPPHGLCFLSCRFLRWLFIEALTSYLPEHSFALHLFLQDTKCLIEVVVSDEYLQARCSSAVASAHMVRDVIEQFIRILKIRGWLSGSLIAKMPGKMQKLSRFAPVDSPKHLKGATSGPDIRC